MTKSTTIELVRLTHDQKQLTKNNTYIVPIKTHDIYLADELMYVKGVTDDSVHIWRALTGKFETISGKDIHKFRLLHPAY